MDLGQQGLFKRMVQPRTLTLSTHWLRNVGTRPYQIKLELKLCGLPLEWETFERNWDPKNRSTIRELLPGKSFNMDWHVDVPPPRFQKK